MTELIIKQEPEGKAKGNGVIRDAMLCYVKLQEGSYKYQSTTEKEYILDVVVNKETAKAWKKAFPKNGFLEVETVDFATKYKVHPPLPDEDEQFIIKVKAKAQMSADGGGLKKGDLIPYEWGSRPKLYIPVEGEENEVEDVTMSVLAGNGSKGSVSFDIVQNDFGTFPQLTGVLVAELIPYEAKTSASPFGHVAKKHEGSGETQQKAQVPDNREPTGDPEDADNPF